MRSRTAPLAAALAALALVPAVATAAPNREAVLATEGATYPWTSEVATGFVYTSDVAENVPACSPIFSCDATLIKTEVPGDLRIGIKGVGLGGQDTMMDLDLHVYLSDEAGTAGEVLAEGVGATATEAAFLEDAEPGYYLVYVDWYLGAGSFEGTADLLTPVIEEEIPEEEF
jgi:hypothetical protein